MDNRTLIAEAERLLARNREELAWAKRTRNYGAYMESIRDSIRRGEAHIAQLRATTAPAKGE